MQRDGPEFDVPRLTPIITCSLMQRLVTGRQMKDIDRRAEQEWQIPGMTLMEHAGRAVVEAISVELGRLDQKRFLVVCGKGNNGGDGFVAVRYLKERGAAVTCLLAAAPAELKGDALANYESLRTAGVPVLEADGKGTLDAALRDHPVVVDALLGTGLTSAPRGLVARVIEAVNRSGCFVVSIDVPSGVDADTGQAFQPSIRADLTVTMALAKLGLWLYPGRALAGKVVPADIGIPAQLLDTAGDTFLLDDVGIRAAIPRRPPDGHKGTFGTALVIAGSRGYSGAACLTGAAAARSGCGMVRMAVPAGIAGIVESNVLEPVKFPLAQTEAESISPAALDMVLELAETADAIAVGPGIGTHPETRRFLLDLLPRLHRPVVIDADGINNLAGKLDLLHEMAAPVILTPHPGELGRLVQLDPARVNADRVELSRRLAREHNIVLVLKGASTVIAVPDGRVLVNPTGNSGLGSGGTGDVLTGLLAGLVAQGAKPMDAACAAVFLHGRAADLAAARLTEYCLVAHDLLDYLPDAFHSVLSPHD